MLGQVTLPKEVSRDTQKRTCDIWFFHNDQLRLAFIVEVCFAGGCAAMIKMLSISEAAAQDAAVFTISNLIRWDLPGVQRSFARHQGDDEVLYAPLFWV